MREIKRESLRKGVTMGKGKSEKREKRRREEMKSRDRERFAGGEREEKRKKEGKIKKEEERGSKAAVPPYASKQGSRPGRRCTTKGHRLASDWHRQPRRGGERVEVELVW